MKCTCPTQRPNARDPTQPIFHWKWVLCLLPNAKKSTPKKWNVHGRRKKFASPNARDTNMLVFLALGNTKVLSFALGDAKVPNATSFAFWWNIGFRDRSLYLQGGGRALLNEKHAGPPHRYRDRIQLFTPPPPPIKGWELLASTLHTL